MADEAEKMEVDAKPEKKAAESELEEHKSLHPAGCRVRQCWASEVIRRYMA